MDNSDEDCDKMVWLVFAGAEVILFLATAALFIVISYHSKANCEQSLELAEMRVTDSFKPLVEILIDEKNEDVDEGTGLYQAFHDQNENYLTFFYYLQFALSKQDYRTKVSVYKRWFDEELVVHGMSTLKANHCLRLRLGTNREAAEFYEFLEAGSLAILLHCTIPDHLLTLWNKSLDGLGRLCKCNRFTQPLQILPTSPPSKWSIGAKSLCVTTVKILFCNADIVKDVLLICALARNVSAATSDFGRQVLGVLIGSVVATEMLNLLATVAFLKRNDFAVLERTAVCLLFSLMPSASIAMAAWWGYRSEILACEATEDLAALVRKQELCREKQTKWQRLFVGFKQNEVSTEHFLQLTVLVTLILLSSSETATVDGFQTVFAARSNFILVLLSTAMSFVTVVRTMVQMAALAKNNFLPLSGKLLGAAGFIVGVTSRFAAVLLYFAPCLGLFGLDMHWKMSQVKFARNLIFEYAESGDGDNATYVPVHYKDRWLPTEYTDYSVWSIEVYMVAFLVMSLAHLSLVFVAKTLCNRRFRQEPFGTDKVLHILSNGIVFVPHGDWDDWLLDSVSPSFKSAWHGTCLERTVLNLIIGLENMFLCTPLLILLSKIRQRETYLEQYFPPLVEESLAAERTRLLSIVAPVLLLIVSPCLQLLLARLYYQFGHPWSRIFREEMKSPKDAKKLPVKDGSEEAELPDGVAGEADKLVRDEEEHVEGELDDRDKSSATTEQVTDEEDACQGSKGDVDQTHSGDAEESPPNPSGEDEDEVKEAQEDRQSCN